MLTSNTATAPGVISYRAGSCRNNERATSHTYAMMMSGDLWPMCGYGWNRSDGHSFSIFRGKPGSQGNCKICERNVAKGAAPLRHGFPHKTAWL